MKPEPDKYPGEPEQWRGWHFEDHGIEYYIDIEDESYMVAGVHCSSSTIHTSRA